MPDPGTLTQPGTQAGATAVVPETLEPGLQLASAVLSNLNMPPDDVQEAIQSFRRNHLMELQVRPLQFLSCVPAMQGIFRQSSWPFTAHTVACLGCRQEVAVLREPMLTWAWGAGTMQEQRLDARLWLWQQHRGPRR